MQVSEIMNKDVIALSSDEPAAYAAKVMARYNIGAVPVTSEAGRLIGIVTDRDIVTRCIAAGYSPEDVPVRIIMSKKALAVSPDDDVAECVRIMSGEKIRRLPVVSANKIVGIVSLGDISLKNKYNMECAHALSEISSNITRTYLL